MPLRRRAQVLLFFYVKFPSLSYLSQNKSTVQVAKKCGFTFAT